MESPPRDAGYHSRYVRPPRPRFASPTAYAEAHTRSVAHGVSAGVPRPDDLRGARTTIRMGESCACSWSQRSATTCCTQSSAVQLRRI